MIHGILGGRYQIGPEAARDRGVVNRNFPFPNPAIVFMICSYVRGPRVTMTQMAAMGIRLRELAQLEDSLGGTV